MLKKKSPQNSSKFNLLQKKITPVHEMALVVSALFYGRAGTGKTTVAATFPEALLLDIREKGTDSVSDVHLDVLKIETWDEFEQAYWYLKSDEHPYKTVIIDAITQLQDVLIDEVSGGGIMSKRDWGEVSGPLKTWLINYRDLTDIGINVVFLAHDRSTDTEEGNDGELAPDIGPRLMPSVATVINGAVKVIGHTFIRERVDKLEGGRVKREVEYCLRLGPHARYLTKIRQPRGAYVPPFLVDPDYEKLVSIIKGEFAPPKAPVPLTRKLKKGA